ncbi:MAG TPA: class I SAM-dependent methyltransferase [Thermoplasmata archaeon]|nr:class I SAM-dependent methyltransferase [Thermoplasmata archaeon]
MSILTRIFESRSVQRRRRDLPTIRTLLAIGPGLSLLDIGGGGGSATVRFAEGCDRIVVAEPDRRKLRYGARRNPSVRFVRATADALPFAGGAFDRVSGVVSLHHVENPDRALREIRRTLRPGGRLVLHEMYPDEHGGAFGKAIGKHMHGSAPIFFEPDDLKRRLEGQGFWGVTVRDGVRGYFVAGAR